MKRLKEMELNKNELTRSVTVVKAIKKKQKNKFSDNIKC